MWIDIRPKLYIVTRMWRGMKTGYKYMYAGYWETGRWCFVSKYLGYRVI